MNLRQSSTPVTFLYAADRDRALRFYCDTLGFELVGSDGFGDFIDMGKGLARMTVMPDHRGGPHPVLGWDVEDIGAAVKALGDRGVRFSIYDGMGQDGLGIWTSPDGRTKVAWFTDPDGNVLSLSES